MSGKTNFSEEQLSSSRNTTEKLTIRLLHRKSWMTKSVKEGKSNRDKWWSQVFTVFYPRTENTQELSLQYTGT